MNSLFSYVFYPVVLGLLALSFVKDKKKTLLSLKRAWKMFITVLPQFLAVLFPVGLLLAALTPEMIQNILGSRSGFAGILISSLVGSVALVPVIIAFPIASELLKSGAGIIQVTVFISTLTTVGIATLPLEIRYLGKKTAVLRNLLAFLFSYVVAFIAGVVAI